MTLVPRLLAHSDQPRLFVIGSQPWLGAFLARMTTAAAVTLLPRDEALWRVETSRMTMADALVLVLANDTRSLVRSVPEFTIPIFTRVVMWAAATAQWRDSRTVLELSWKCLLNAVLLLTAPNGTVTLYRHPCNCSAVPLTIAEDNRWEPESGWKRPDAPFQRPCRRWKPPNSGVHLAHVENMDYGINVSLWAAGMKHSLEAFSKYHGVPLDIRRMGEEERMTNGLTCRFDMDVGRYDMRLGHTAGYTVFPWGMTQAFAVVPAGLVRYQELFTSYLSEAKWQYLVAAVLVVAVGMYLLRSPGPLTVEASVARKATPGRLHLLQRPLLGWWLVVGVILTTSYQGQLLCDLSARTAMGNVDSLDQLVASNLTIHVHSQLFGSLFPLKEWGLKDKVRYTTSEGYSVSHVFKHIADSRNAATIIKEEYIPPEVRYLFRENHLHLFRLPIEMLGTNYVVMQGSPFEVSLKKFLGRTHAAGLGFGQQLSANTDTVTAPPRSSRFERPQPLSLEGLRSVLYILLVGFPGAWLVLLLEFQLYNGVDRRPRIEVDEA